MENTIQSQGSTQIAALTMKVTLNAVSVFAVLAGVLSFTFLAAALATDFWYQIDASGLEKLTNHTGSLKSHRGLWRTCQCKYVQDFLASRCVCGGLQVTGIFNWLGPLPKARLPSGPTVWLMDTFNVKGEDCCILIRRKL